VCSKTRFVLSGLTTHLASHFGKSSSNRSDGYDFENDLPNCIASSAVNSGSLMKYSGNRDYR
jgi:hypothetical protein